LYNWTYRDLKLDGQW